MIKINKVYNEDCLIGMKKLEKESIDLVLTDPPYGTNYKKIIGDENLDMFISSLIEIYRVLKNNKFFITYCFPKYLNTIINEAEKLGFEYKWIGFNYYPNMFKQKPQPLGLNRYDMFIIFAKGEPKKNKCIKDTIHILMDKNNYKDRKYGHPHQKPEKCALKLIKSASREGDLVLDPFCGSGMFLKAAKQYSRNYIGFEIDKNFYDIATNFLDDKNEVLTE